MTDERTTNPDELGALWVKTNARGTYLTGKINGVAVVCFANASKVPGDARPDYRVLKSKPREATTAQRARDDHENDIPF